MSSSPVLIATPAPDIIMDQQPHHAVAIQQQQHSTFNNNQLGRRKRKEVAVFVKVLLDYLQRSEPTLKRRVKEVVANCISKSREGDAQFSNLAHSIKSHAREAVGEWHWTRAKLIILYARQSSRKGQRQKDQRQVAPRTA